MTEEGSTMAMLVLRLAGLLSLERASYNSSWSGIDNQSLMLEDNNISSHFPNADSLINSNVVSEISLYSRSLDFVPNKTNELGESSQNDASVSKSKKYDQPEENIINNSDFFYHDEDGVEKEFLLKLGQPSIRETDKLKSDFIKTDASVLTSNGTKTTRPKLESSEKRILRDNINANVKQMTSKNHKYNSERGEKSTKKIKNEDHHRKKLTIPMVEGFQNTEAALSSEVVEYDSIPYNPPPPLSSLSLISPIPKKGKEQEHKKYLLEISTNETELNVTEEYVINDSSNKDYNGNEIILVTEEPSNNTSYTIESNKNKEKKMDQNLHVIQEIKNINNASERTNVTRNNPYPYGPKYIPVHITSLNYDLEPENTTSSVGNIFTDNNFHIDQETFEEKKFFDKKFIVKTEKPLVLFHFDKPGYTPKIPDSSLPPTRSSTPSDPWDCSPRCPNYKLLDWNPDYDVRQYPVMTWVSTVIIANNRILAELEGYMKVQDYFFGLNDRGQLLNLTVPFVTQIKHGQHPGVLNEVTDYSVSLFVNHIDDPYNYDLPTPISNEVLIDRLESKTVFVSGFEANVWEVTEDFLKEKVSFLMDKLRHNGEAFLNRYFYLASYSRPELYQPVYYEVWVYGTTFRTNVHPDSPYLLPRKRPSPNTLTMKSVTKLCRGIECPPFEVLRTYRYGIQKRRYFDGLFATSTPNVCEFSTLAVWKGFMPLHLYKHGINSHMEVIEATRPIALVHVKEDSTPMTECPQNLTMAIYLPKRLHSNPPLTGFDAPLVSVIAMKDLVVYSYTVGGYLLDPHRVRKELSDLKFRLAEFGACFKKDQYYVVVYDFIVRYHGRQNEIWVVAENCKATKNG